MDFERCDCRRMESSRGYFTEPEVLTRTLPALWTLFTPIMPQAAWGRGLEKHQGTLQPPHGSPRWRSSAGSCLSSSERRDGLSLRSTRLPPPASSTTLFAAGLIVPGTAHVTGSEQGKKKMQSQPRYSSLPLHTLTHTHSYSHTRTNGNWPGEQFINIFQIATLFLQWLCSKLINVSNKIDHKSKSQVTWGTVWGGNRDEFPGRKKERKKKKYAGHQAAQSVSSRRGQGRQPQSHPDKHCFSSLPSFKPRTA